MNHRFIYDEILEIKAVFAAIRDDLLKKYRHDQLRVPAGSPQGGQFADEGRSTGRSRAYDNPQIRLIVHSPKKITIQHHIMYETRSNGSRAWRNNNPGNIVYGKFAITNGAIGNNSGFAVFPDEATGQAASIALLKTTTYRNLTIDQAIFRRSPPIENDTLKLQQIIRKMGGFSGKEKISELSPSQLMQLGNIIKRTEGWVEGSVNRVKK